MEVLSKNKIKWIRSLRLKKNRENENCFVVEGEKMIHELIQEWPALIEFICTTDPHFNYDGTIYLTDDATLKQISSLSTFNKIIAVVKKPKIERKKDASFILALDGVQDPGNMGTIIRTADWFDIDEIICSKTSVDVYNSKVIQSSMGSIFRVPIVYEQIEDYLAKASLPIYGALLEGDNVYKESLDRKGIILMGNEGNGISEELLKYITQPIHIPRFGNAESLNVSIATAILLSEFSR